MAALADLDIDPEDARAMLPSVRSGWAATLSALAYVCALAVVAGGRIRASRPQFVAGSCVWFHHVLFLSSSLPRFLSSSLLLFIFSSLPLFLSSYLSLFLSSSLSISHSPILSLSLSFSSLSCLLSIIAPALSFCVISLSLSLR